MATALYNFVRGAMLRKAPIDTATKYVLKKSNVTEIQDIFVTSLGKMP